LIMRPLNSDLGAVSSDGLIDSISNGVTFGTRTVSPGRSFIQAPAEVE
jgi:hypothetical protein